MADSSSPPAAAPAAPAAEQQLDSGSSYASAPASSNTLRPEVVQSALAFLQHPSVMSAPMSQRVAFLEQKGMSRAEIDAAISRSASYSPAPVAPAGSYGAGFAPAHPGYGAGPQAPFHPQGPQADWKDWFIMSVVGGSVGYGLYKLGKRWLYPYLQPPSNTALEADLAALTARYDAVEKQLASLDATTASAKAAIDAQQAMVVAATRDVHDALKEADRREAQRDQEVRQLQRQVDDVNAQLNRMFDAHREAQKASLEGIANEVKSLKTLFVSRAATPSHPIGSPQMTNAAPASNSPPYASARPTVPRPSVPAWQLAGGDTSKPASTPSIPSWQLLGGSGSSSTPNAQTTDATTTTPSPTQASEPAAASGASTVSIPQLPKPSIPAWQLETPSAAPQESSAQTSTSTEKADAVPGTSDGRDPAQQ